MKAIEIMVASAVGFVIGWYCCHKWNMKAISHKCFTGELKEII